MSGQHTTSEERQMLADSARRYLEKDYTFAARTRALADGVACSPQQWAQFAQMGWLGVGLDEAHGGFGDAMDQVVLAEEMGRAMVIEPWLANLGLCAPLLRACGARGEALLPAMVEGRSRFALAAWEPTGRYDAFDVRTRARSSDGKWSLNGHKTLVLGAAAAEHWLVLARTDGAARDTSGLALFLVPADTQGVALRALPTYDGRHTADLTFTDVSLDASAMLCDAGTAWPLVEAAIDRATVLACAEAVGTMSLAFETTRGYLQSRRQFGRVLTDNQVIRHRLVDLYVAIEQSRAITEAAAARLGDTGAERRRAVSLAKAFVSPAARRVGEDSVQLHGAIGMTEEYIVGQCYKRLSAFANLFGDEAWHLARLGEPDAGDEGADD